jgi:hypothetical protein
MKSILNTSPLAPSIAFRLTVLALILGVLSPAPAAQSRPSEYQVKAVYLFNFSRFVEWPAEPAASPNEPFSICVLGQDPFGAALGATLAGETVGGRRLVANRIEKPQDALTCRVLFVSISEQSRLRAILDMLDKKSVLTVSDIPRFAEQGGMIEFVMQGEKVRFEVNLTNATEAGLKLSSELLKVAVTVRGKHHAGG